MSATSEIIAALRTVGVPVDAPSPTFQGNVLRVGGAPLRVYAWQVTDNGSATGTVRPADERRIQAIASNGNLINLQADCETVVLGWCDEFASEPLLVAFNPYGVASRVNGKIERKVAAGATSARASDSQQFRQNLLDAAVANGVAVGTNQHGEHVIAMKPERFLEYLWQYKPTYHSRHAATGTAQLGALGFVATSGWPVASGTYSHPVGPLPATMLDLVTDAEVQEAAPADVLDTGFVPAFDPSQIEDGRERVARQIAIRRGQVAFRRSLLNAYDCCAMTGCRLEDALEAAHIVPYQGPGTNHISNGLLLRADVHTLFDLCLLAVDADTLTILVAPRLECTEYESLRGQRLHLRNGGASPSREALRVHRWLAAI